MRNQSTFPSKTIWLQLLLLVFVSTPSFGQKKDAPAGSFDALQDSIRTYVSTDFAKAKTFTSVYLNKAKKENDFKNIGYAYEATIEVELYNNEAKYAKETFQKYLAFAREKKNNELIIRAYCAGSDVELNAPNGSGALNYLNLALALAEKTKNDFWKEIVMNKMSVLYYIMGDYTKVVQIRKKTVEYLSSKPADSSFTEERKNISLMTAYFMLCEGYRNMKNIDSAKYYNNLMKKYVSKVDPCIKRYYYVNCGENAFLEKKYKEAKMHYLKTEGICDVQFPLYDLNMAFRYGKIEFAEKRYPQTIEVLKKGLDDYGVKPEEEGYMDEYYKILAEAYKKTGNFELANTYFEKYINTKKEFSKIKGDMSASLRENEIKVFQSELKKLKEEKNAKNIAINVLLLGSSLSILILLLILLRFYRIRKANEIRFEELMTKLTSSENHVIDSKDEELEETSSSDVPPEVTAQILEGLAALEEKKYFLSQDCNSYNVAKKIKTNTTYLSKVVNQKFEKNFNTYINDLRINYAIVQLKDDRKFRSFSIQSIAEELGYKSADSFTKYFKIHTGLNPSFYIKQLNSL